MCVLTVCIEKQMGFDDLGIHISTTNLGLTSITLILATLPAGSIQTYRHPVFH